METSGNPVMRRQPLAHAWQKAVHVLLVLLGWCLFAWSWWHVLTTQAIDPRDVTILVVGSLLILPMITLFWILHNRNIYRMKGPRTNVRPVEESHARDWEGRTMHGDWEALKRASVVNVSLDDSGKHFRT